MSSTQLHGKGPRKLISNWLKCIAASGEEAGGTVVWVMMQFATNDFAIMFSKSKIGPPQLKKCRDLPLVTAPPGDNSEVF